MCIHLSDTGVQEKVFYSTTPNSDKNRSNFRDKFGFSPFGKNLTIKDRQRTSGQPAPRSNFNCTENSFLVCLYNHIEGDEVVKSFYTWRWQFAYWQMYETNNMFLCFCAFLKNKADSAGEIAVTHCLQGTVS